MLIRKIEKKFINLGKPSGFIAIILYQILLFWILLRNAHRNMENIKIKGSSNFVKEEHFREGRGHMTLPDDVLAGKRVYVIGDVHGCKDELIQLLNEIACLDDTAGVVAECVVVLTGDFVNNGPHNIETLRWIQSNWGRIYAVAGNHEENALEEWGYEKWWTYHASEYDKAFLQSLPWTITLSMYKTVVVHAGLIPNVPLAEQKVEVMTYMRNLERDGDEYISHVSKKDPGENWAKIYAEDEKSERYVVYGHDASRGKHGVIEFNMSRGLDTRCFKGGDLTAIQLPIFNNAYTQVKCECYSDC